MKNLLKIVLILFFWGLLFEQSIAFDLDSLQQKLAKTQDISQKIDLLYEISTEYWFENPKNAITYSQQALKLVNDLLKKDSKNKKYKEKKANILNSLGVAYYVKGDMLPAQQNYFEALMFYEELNDKEGMAHIYNNLGLIYENLLDFDKTLAYQLKAYQIRKDLKDNLDVGASLNNIGLAYFRLKNYDQAIQHFQKAKSFFKQHPQEQNGLSETLNNIGLVLYTQKKYKEALKTLHEAATIQQKINNQFHQAQCFIYQSQIYEALQDFDKSEALALKALKIAQPIQARTEIKTASKILTDYYKRKNRTQEVIKFQDLYIQYNDSLLREESHKKALAIQMDYELYQQEKKSELIVKNQKINDLLKYIFVGTSIFLFLMLGLLYRQFKLQKKLFTQTQKSLQVQKELADMQAQTHKINQDKLQKELALKHIQEDALKEEIAYKERALTSFSLNMIRKNEFLEEVKETAYQVLEVTADNSKGKFNKLIKVIDHTLSTDTQWDEFKYYFDQTHPKFFENLKNAYPKLTSTDLKVCALLRLNLNTKEMASILGISPDSVKMARHRIRKKLNLASEENFYTFLLEF
jgi:tetratricopeptide (TPR) repeat protein